MNKFSIESYGEASATLLSSQIDEIAMEAYVMFTNKYIASNHSEELSNIFLKASAEGSTNCTITSNFKIPEDFFTPEEHKQIQEWEDKLNSLFITTQAYNESKFGREVIRPYRITAYNEGYKISYSHFLVNKLKDNILPNIDCAITVDYNVINVGGQNFKLISSFYLDWCPEALRSIHLHWTDFIPFAFGFYRIPYHDVDIMDFIFSMVLLLPIMLFTPLGFKIISILIYLLLAVFYFHIHYKKFQKEINKWKE